MEVLAVITTVADAVVSREYSHVFSRRRGRARRFDWFIGVSPTITGVDGVTLSWYDLDFPGRRPSRAGTHQQAFCPPAGFAHLALRSWSPRRGIEAVIRPFLVDFLHQNGFHDCERAMEDTLQAALWPVLAEGLSVPDLPAVLRDLESAIVAYCNEVLDASSRSVGVVLGTPAASEVVQDPQLRFDWNIEPVRTAHTLVRLGHLFVVDQLRTLVRVTTLAPPALYGPFVVGRSILDAAGVTLWLGEPTIGAIGRVQRRLVTDLIEAREQRVPNRPEFQAKRAELREIPDRIEVFCAHHCWAISRGRSPSIGSVSRPSRPEMIGAVVDTDLTALSHGLGATLWWFLSGHTHSTSDALISVVERRDGPADPTKPNALLVVDGTRLVWLLVACSKAARRLTAQRHALLGDMSDRVEPLGVALDQQLLRYLEAVQKGGLPAPTRT